MQNLLQNLVAAAESATLVEFLLFGFWFFLDHSELSYIFIYLWLSSISDTASNRTPEENELHIFQTRLLGTKIRRWVGKHKP